MNYLLDTHAFLWALIDPEKLGTEAKEVLEDGRNNVHVSVVSYWEITIKHALGKLDLNGTTPDKLVEAAEKISIATLNLDVAEAATYHHLPKTAHKDPFDRMIVWQAIRKGFQLISSDQQLQLYIPHGLALL